MVWRISPSLSTPLPECSTIYVCYAAAAGNVNRTKAAHTHTHMHAHTFTQRQPSIQACTHTQREIRRAKDTIEQQNGQRHSSTLTMTHHVQAQCLRMANGNIFTEAKR